MRVRFTVTRAVPRSQCSHGGASATGWAVPGHGASQPSVLPKPGLVSVSGQRCFTTNPPIPGWMQASQNIRKPVLSPISQISPPLARSQPPEAAGSAWGRHREWGWGCPQSPAHLSPLPVHAEWHASGPPAQDEVGPSQCPPYTTALILLLGHPRVKKYNA